MKILAIDTSTNACSAALMIDQEIIERFEIAPMKHTQLILPMVDELLTQSKLSLSQLDGLTFAAGPGSFTGIRIATGVIQGLGFGANLPVVPVSTLAILAQGTVRMFQAKKILSALDARMGQVYWGAYQLGSNNLVECVQEDCVIDPNNIEKPDGNDWVGVGSGWEPYKMVLQNICQACLKSVYSDEVPHAQDLLKLAEMALREGKGISAEKALPVYLRDNVV